MPSKEALKNNLEEVEKKIVAACQKSDRDRSDVLLLPVSKTFDPEILRDAQELGVKCFGESYAQELKSKYEWFAENDLTQPEWHFIGHLQRNKVKYIAPFVDLIHSVDSLRLAIEINKQAEKNKRIIDILLQINTSGEDSKFGYVPSLVLDQIDDIKNLENIKIKGLMTIAGLEASIEENIEEFKLLNEFRDKISTKLDKKLKVLSMGMSGDYQEAIEYGSNIIRVGSAIFGKRSYQK